MTIADYETEIKRLRALNTELLAALKESVDAIAYCLLWVDQDRDNEGEKVVASLRESFKDSVKILSKAEAKP